ncbi:MULTISPECIES: pilus assembly PilX family protein [Pseudomonas]|uniref:Pilus assembly protein PilX n=1 Tax=Pseudomonas oryzihabitans TaxID=47885 RepID=A0A2Z5AFE7_9PSED|nr:MULTISPECIES: PilX N-terminal domain-containing pilus assembly protein [Pseudomonas]AXA68626.1 pilus assembly protein PilX [Pseudomonas oryzihabitans]
MRKSVERQQGAVLIVTLVMLLLMTLIALASMRGTTLQERMAGNARDQSQAFQASEMAQRQAEAFALTRSVTDWQNTAQTANWTNADALTDLPNQSRFRINPTPGVNPLRSGDGLQVIPLDVSVLRIETQGAGAATTAGAGSASTANVTINTIFVRR